MDMPRRLGALLAAALLATACGGGGGAESPPAANQSQAPVTIKVWTRAATESHTKALADAYNASHTNKVEVTAYPNEEYPAKIATAAGGKNLPDLFASDVVFAPNYVSQGLWIDVTERFGALPFKDKVAPAHIKEATVDGKIYAVPHTVDTSVLFMNKALYTKAGLDPEKPPTSLKEMAEQATTIREKVGGDTYGTYFGGNCGGCTLFTFWPSVWAGGGDVMNPEGTQSTVDAGPMGAVFDVYRKLFEAGVAAPGSKEENGTTWLGALQAGNIGVAPGPSAWLGLLEEKGIDVGVAPIPGVDGGTSTFVGGDVIGISATSTQADAAWDFLAFTLSDQVQSDLQTKSRTTVARTDLTASDPRVQTMNEVMAVGRTPYALKFNESYNDSQSPWLKTLRDALFGADPAAALKAGAGTITASLNQQ
ncbi:sugar ABC transporter substrate-binding protein [Acrocarpospora macrocephala]|uniref:Sugar ABC transporter substrate-binding protein n=1 Tax=Acrocarpospora macrocephala TaxID=150177 RepID=A0A5M3X1L3_9ACTN|nr:sugar ABC transporter substrate-binding protein [Acrocarpospora macrocephala]GES12198.1 sugar ABC transporter substrate-binding protein [Acrocarpospora macrocephala]